MHREGVNTQEVGEREKYITSRSCDKQATDNK